jgi:predicted transcriptional regulator of viral defense system
MQRSTALISYERRSDAALNQLQARAQYYFRPAEFARLTERRPDSASVTMALHRLAKRGRIVAVTRRPSGYLIIPPEHASFGAPPFSWWIDDCMKQVDPHYYVGLLTAAQHWGSAHYARQDVQVLTSRVRPPLTPGRLKITFVEKRGLEVTPTVEVSTGVAPWRVSTRASTVLDLLRHQDTIGGLEALVKALRDLAPSIKSPELREALDALDQRSTAQRLGFLLDRLGNRKLARVVSSWLGARSHRAPQPLELGIVPSRRLETDNHWHVAFDPARVKLALELQ